MSHDLTKGDGYGIPRTHSAEQMETTRDGDIAE